MALPLKKNLSKNLSGMKFMQRGSHSSSYSESGDQVLSSGGELIEKWIVPNVSTVTSMSPKMKCTNSFAECEDLNRLGRFSYNKFNKEIERLSERYARQGGVLDLESGEEEEEEEEASVSVQEMVKRYEDNASRRLLGKRGRLDDDDFDSSPRFSSGATGRHRLLEKRVSKMDKHGFLIPS